MTMKRTWTFALMAAALAVTVASNSLVHGKGKPPKDPPPEPDPPPVTYQITWITHQDGGALPLGMNSNGDVVGLMNGAGYAFLYTEADGLTDLNDLVAPDDLIDPDYGPLVLIWASDINDVGQIAGTAEDINGDLYLFRFTLSGDAAVNGTFELLGQPDLSDQAAGSEGINNDGDICGQAIDANGYSYAFYYTDKDRDGDGEADGFVEITAGTIAYDINDAGDVVGHNSVDGTAFLYTPGSGSVTYSAPDGSDASTTAFAINESGQFVGGTQFVTPKGKAKFADNYQAYHCINGVNLEDLGSELGYRGRGINESGDILFRSQGIDGMIYLEGVNTIVNLDDAVTGPEATDWRDRRIFATEINDAGQITGHAILGGGNAWGFILTPVAP